MQCKLLRIELTIDVTCLLVHLHEYCYIWIRNRTSQASLWVTQPWFKAFQFFFLANTVLLLCLLFLLLSFILYFHFLSFTSSFLVCFCLSHLLSSSCIIWRLRAGCIPMFCTYLMIALLLEMSPSWVEAVCELWVMIYSTESGPYAGFWKGGLRGEQT